MIINRLQLGMMEVQSLTRIVFLINVVFFHEWFRCVLGMEIKK